MPPAHTPFPVPTDDTAAPYPVHIVDDDDSVRLSLSALLTAHGLATQAYASGDAFLAQAPLHAPGCVLLDLRMPGLSGLQVFEALTQQASVLKTVFLSAHGELASAVAAVKQGAVDWLEKPCDEGPLLAAVHRALQLSHTEAQRTAQWQDRHARWRSLSPRQQEVALLLAQGLSSKEAARALNERMPERPLDPRTVDTHRAAIFLKLDIRTTHELGVLVHGLALS